MALLEDLLAIAILVIAVIVIIDFVRIHRESGKD